MFKQNTGKVKKKIRKSTKTEEEDDDRPFCKCLKDEVEMLSHFIFNQII